MRRFIVTLAAVMLSAPAFAAPARPLPVRQLEVAPKEVILGWINQYRHHPEPDKVPLAVRGMSRLGLLTDTEGAEVGEELVELRGQRWVGTIVDGDDPQRHGPLGEGGRSMRTADAGTSHGQAQKQTAKQHVTQ